MRQLPTFNAMGSPVGSWSRVWFADVAGERIPCLHSFHCTWKDGGYYNQPSKTSANPIHRAFVEIIKNKGYVIITRDTVTPKKDGSGGFDYKRKPKPEGYVGIFTVENVELDEHGLRFKIADRIAHLK